jgi:acetolactate synthase-1/2/3 large subunit
LPGNHPHFLGYSRSAIPPEADLVLVIDCDVPWLPQIGRPSTEALVVGIDIDPLKSTIGLWDFVYDHALQADTAVAIPALNQALDAYLAEQGSDQLDGAEARRRWIRTLHERQAQVVPKRGPGEERVRAVLAALRRQAPDKHIVICEAPSHTEVMPDALRMEMPGSLHHSGGSGLGWGINAALGAKLANPDHLVTAIVGDGCFMFGVPTSCYWVSRHYRIPFLTVLLNNGGWRSPSISTNLIHPDGPAKASNRYHMNAGRGVRFDGVAAAAGEVATFVIDADEVIEAVLERAIQEVRAGRSALVTVELPLVSDD